MSRRIVRAERSHLNDIAHLFSQSSSPTGERELQEEWERFQTRLYVALAPRAEADPTRAPGEALVGALLAWLVADELTILDVAVVPAHRRAGHGRALVVEALRAARVEGGRLALLEVRVGNAPARALYRTMGFEESRVRRGYYADGEDGVEMHATLA